jgi:hypothetical protein
MPSNHTYLHSRYAVALLAAAAARPLALLLPLQQDPQHHSLIRDDLLPPPHQTFLTTPPTIRELNCWRVQVVQPQVLQSIPENCATASRLLHSRYTPAAQLRHACQYGMSVAQLLQSHRLNMDSLCWRIQVVQPPLCCCCCI